MHRQKKWSCFSLAAVFLLLGVTSFGCTTQHGNVRNGYGVGEIPSAKDLHLKKNYSSDQMEAGRELPEMTSEEHERLGDIAFSRGDLGPAFIHYEKSRELNPDNSAIHYKKGLLLTIGKMNEEAISEFDKVLKKEPKHALSHEGLGLAHFQMKKYGDAETCFRKALELDPTLWKAHNFLGAIYDYKKEYGKAVREYEAAIVLKEDNGLLYNNLGTSYFLAGDYVKAINALKRGLSTKNAKSKIYNNLGLALCSAGKYQKALEAFRGAGDEAQAYNNLGCAYLEKGKYQEAIHCFEKAMHLKPTFYAKASENLRKAKRAQILSVKSVAQTASESGTSEEKQQPIEDLDTVRPYSQPADRLEEVAPNDL